MRYGIVLAVLALTLSSCTLGGPEGGYAFLDVNVQPITDQSNMIMLPATDDRTSSRSYDLLIEIENMMANPAEDIMVQVSNANPSLIDFSDLNGNTKDRLGGFEKEDGEPWFDVVSASVPIYEPRDTYSTQLRYHVCAETTTTFIDTICIAPNDATRSYDTPCQPVDKEFRTGQQAPVAVTGIRQADAVDRVTIYIDVVNFGPGIVFENTGSCSRITQEDTGTIYLTRMTISNTSVDIEDDCQTEARMGFSKKYQSYTGTTFSCSIDKDSIGIGEDSTVTTDLSVELTYDYHILADTQPIIIKRYGQ